MLGSEVELFARRARVLHDFDRELVERLQENYRQTGIALRLEHDVTALERAGAGRVRIAGVAEAFDAVLFATGRQPNTGDLGLDARSEEHTSELQSLMRISYAVFCLKKTKTMIHDMLRYNHETHLHYTTNIHPPD